MDVNEPEPNQAPEILPTCVAHPTDIAEFHQYSNFLTSVKGYVGQVLDSLLLSAVWGPGLVIETASELKLQTPRGYEVSGGRPKRSS